MNQLPEQGAVQTASQVRENLNSVDVATEATYTSLLEIERRLEDVLQTIEAGKEDVINKNPGCLVPLAYNLHTLAERASRNNDIAVDILNRLQL
jgi:hypothetical protein